MTHRILLLDGDIVSYRCGAAAEHTKYTLTTADDVIEFDGKRAMNTYLKEHPEIIEYEWMSDLSVEPLTFVLATVKRMIEHICAGAGSDKYIVFLSSDTNFRNEIATIQKYKGNRDKQRKPIHLPEIRQYLLDNHPTVIVDDLEADDLLADTSIALNILGYDPVICTIDKDMMQVPGKYYDFVKQERSNITKDTALRKFYKQMLTGDTSDNIPGIYKIGPVTAEKLLADCVTEDAMIQAVSSAWQDYLDGPIAPEWADKEASISEILLELERLLTVGVEFNGSNKKPRTEENATQYLQEYLPQWIREYCGFPAGEGGS